MPVKGSESRCRLGPVIRRSNEVKFASAKFRLRQGSFSFLLYLRTHPISPEKRITTGERDYRPRRRVSIMREVRRFDPFLAKSILSCFRTSEGKITISFFRFRATITRFSKCGNILLVRGRRVKEFEKIFPKKEVNICARMQLAERFSRWEKSGAL